MGLLRQPMQQWWGLGTVVVPGAVGTGVAATTPVIAGLLGVVGTGVAAATTPVIAGLLGVSHAVSASPAVFDISKKQDINEHATTSMLPSLSLAFYWLRICDRHGVPECDRGCWGYFCCSECQKHLQGRFTRASCNCLRGHQNPGGDPHTGHLHQPCPPITL